MSKRGFTPLEKIANKLNDKNISADNGLMQASALSLNKKFLTGFTLVEMMVAVSILAIGIVLISRFFLNTVTVLDSLRNRVAAISLLNTKINDLKEKVFEESGSQLGDTQESVIIGNRDAMLSSEISQLVVDELGREINEVKLKLLWNEGGKTKDEVLVTFLPSGK